MNMFPEKAFMQGLRTEIVRLSRSGGKSIIEGQSCNVAHRNSRPVGRDILVRRSDTVIHAVQMERPFCNDTIVSSNRSSEKADQVVITY
ncbi:MAG: hypothetical protein M1839_008981 [Geoglossum umbratile]|nr:MAG: hypothetical protein M1839_008981 [Geoglossum umbratile]